MRGRPRSRLPRMTSSPWIFARFGLAHLLPSASLTFRPKGHAPGAIDLVLGNRGFEGGDCDDPAEQAAARGSSCACRQRGRPGEAAAKAAARAAQNKLKGVIRREKRRVEREELAQVDEKSATSPQDKLDLLRPVLLPVVEPATAECRSEHAPSSPADPPISTSEVDDAPELPWPTRLIAFERCVAKVLEAVVARRLSHLGERGLWPVEHVGGRKGRSAEDAVVCCGAAVHHVVHERAHLCRRRCS